jgi:hypothetical protein
VRRGASVAFLVVVKSLNPLYQTVVDAAKEIASPFGCARYASIVQPADHTTKWQECSASRGAAFAATRPRNNLMAAARIRALPPLVIDYIFSRRMSSRL